MSRDMDSDHPLHAPDCACGHPRHSHRTVSLRDWDGDCLDRGCRCRRYRSRPKEATTMDPEQMMDVAARRYLTDAEFHAKVDVAVSVLGMAAGDNGAEFDSDMVRYAAAVALLVDEGSLHLSSPV